MEKTLIGKDGYLFLKNDSCRELEVHCNNLCLVTNNLDRYNNYLRRYFLTVFPNKSYIHKDYLPPEYYIKYRPGFNKYAKYFGNRILDCLPLLSADVNTYYRTDTHINLYGAYIIYKQWVECVNRQFGLNIVVHEAEIRHTVVSGLSDLGLGIGDLTWPSNLGQQVLQDTTDIYFFSDQIQLIYMKYPITSTGAIRLLDDGLSDLTSEHDGNIIDWNILSKFILYKNTTNGIDKKVCIFYDSFLQSTMSLYMDIFREVYMIKNVYDQRILDAIKPDLVFEFRVERFLF